MREILCSGTFCQFCIELAEDKLEDQGGKHRAEGAALSEPFMLEERVPGGVRRKVPAGVCCIIQ
jgi:hypothetical protein